jgi:cobalt-zinc-cadmium efflux system membrane fusion protein
MNANRNDWTDLYPVFLVVLMVLFAAPALAEEDSHDEHAGHIDEEEHDEHDDEVRLIFSPAERTEAGIEIGTVSRRSLTDTLRLPGEVIPNAYSSATVSSRITAEVVDRHTQMGATVVTGDPLVTLSSVAMADAQGALIVADREWKRVKGLGAEVVSERRYTEADVTHQLAMGKVIAYGMTPGQARALLTTSDVSLANGSFDLLAPQAGTIMFDEFVVGEVIEPGHILFQISDESTLWVEARTSADKIGAIETGMVVRVSPDQQQWREARVIQIHHRLDESTRTQAIRVELPNEDDWIHPGQFVEVEVAIGGEDTVVAIPKQAVMLLKGSSVVFRLEDDNEFHPEQIQTGDATDEWIEVTNGLQGGDRIAVRGTFFLKSLLLKSELGDGHAH